MFFTDDDIIFKPELCHFHRYIHGVLEDTSLLKTIFTLECSSLSNIYTHQLHPDSNLGKQAESTVNDTGN
jgi:hypothetical protein